MSVLVAALVAGSGQPIFAAGTAVGLAGVVWLLLQPRTALYLFILAFPLSATALPISAPFSITAGNVLLLLAVGGAGAGLLIGALQRPQLSRVTRLALWLAALFLVAQLIAAAYAPDADAGLRRLVTQVGGVLAFVAPILLLRTVAHVRTALLFAIVAATATSLFGVMVALGWITPPEGLATFTAAEHLTGFDPGFRRPRVLGLGYGAYGTWLLYLLPWLLLMVVRPVRPGGARLLAFAVVVVLVAGLVTNFARGSWAGAAVMVVAMGLWSTPRATRTLVLLSVGGIALLALVLGLVGTLTDAVVDLRPDNVGNRLLTYRVALEAFIEQPLFGHGLKGFDLKFADRLFFSASGPEQLRIAVASGIDNAGLAVLADSGLVGFLPYVGLIATGMIGLGRTARRSSGELAFLSTALWLGLIGGIASLQFYVGVSEKGLWLMLGLAHVLISVEQRAPVQGERAPPAAPAPPRIQTLPGRLHGHPGIPPGVMRQRQRGE